MRTAADVPDNVRGLIVRGRDAWAARDYPRARDLFGEALAVAQEAGDRFAQAAAYHFLGNVAFNESDDEASRRFHLAALELSRADNDARGEATSLGSIALVDVSGGDLGSARTNYELRWRPITAPACLNRLSPCARKPMRSSKAASR